QRIERLAGRHGMGEENGVDSAGACPGEDVDEDAEVSVRLELDPAEQMGIDLFRLAGCVRAARRAVDVLAGPRQPPDFLRDAVHVDGEADTAIAYQGDPQLLLAHRRSVLSARGAA